MPPFLTEAVSVTNADAVFDHGGCLRIVAQSKAPFARVE
jgi:hypothetical protein